MSMCITQSCIHKVGNAEDSFSHAMAHLAIIILTLHLAEMIERLE